MSKLITLENLATFKEQIDVIIGDSFAANDAMVFKGTIGTSGTVTALPTSGYSAGWTYKVITAGTYAGVSCEVGDLIVAVKDYGTAFANSDWTVAQSNLEVTTSVDTSSKVPTANAVKSFVEGKGYLTSQTQLSKGTEANTTETLSFGGTFTAMSETSVSNHKITDNTITYTLPTETSLSTGSSTATKTLEHGKTFTAITGISVSGHKITPTTTTYTMPSDNNTDTKVNVTLGTTTKAYLLGTSTTPTSSAQGVTAIADTNVYLDTAAGSLRATKFVGDLEGNAASATTADTATTATSATTAGTASKLGSANKGSNVKPIYLNAGSPVESNANIGSGTQPVYMASGAITVSGSNVGGVAQPVYMTKGTITPCTMATEDDITALFA